MAKVPFTPGGVAAKTAELYALSDNDLLNQAREAGDDFALWFRENFALEPSQDAYFSAAPPALILFWGYQFGAAFIGRRPVTLSRLPDKPRRTKQGNTESSVSAIYIPERDGQPAQTLFDGEITIEFIND
jgi:hypothetical protein